MPPKKSVRAVVVEKIFKIPEIPLIERTRYEYHPKITDERIFVHPDNRITDSMMNDFEITAVINERAKQIENDAGNLCFTDTTGLSDPIEMAKKELLDKKCPLDLLRPVGPYWERWHVNEMTISKI